MFANKWIELESEAFDATILSMNEYEYTQTKPIIKEIAEWKKYGGEAKELIALKQMRLDEQAKEIEELKENEKHYHDKCFDLEKEIKELDFLNRTNMDYIFNLEERIKEQESQLIEMADVLEEIRSESGKLDNKGQFFNTWFYKVSTLALSNYKQNKQ